MLSCISDFKPLSIEVETVLKPFIPDFIAAVGDLDAFIKVPRPDGEEDGLGLSVLDEPCLNQSDANVLDLKLRALSKQTTKKEVSIRSIKDPNKNSKEVTKWIRNISDLHKAKPPPNVHYVRNMPEMSSLMSEWPQKYEEQLHAVKLPTAEIECGLQTYVDLACALNDIPVYNSRIQSLHLLFSLYLEFKNSQHFNRSMPVANGS